MLSVPYSVATMGQEFPVSWTVVSTTTNYELEGSRLESFSGAPAVSEGSALYTEETPATQASPYYEYYRVRACNGVNVGGCSGWSNVGQMRVNPNLQCTRPPCHPVGGGGPLAKPTVKGGGSGPSGGGDPAVTWNALGEAQAIVTGSTTIHLTYGPAGGLVDTSGAYGGRYFGRWLKWQSNTQWSARIIVNGQVVAVVKDSAGSVATSYLVAGPLGSTRAVANASGSLTQRIAYSAWGKFVNPDTGTGTVSAASIAATTTVTYTGHELLATAGLINMGARLYDPATGLFMSPDPTVAYPFDTQDLNQYSYVGDNPMTFVDPSGYETEECNSKGVCWFELAPIVVSGGSLGVFASGGPSGPEIHGPRSGDLFFSYSTVHVHKTLHNTRYQCPKSTPSVSQSMLSKYAQNTKMLNATVITIYGEVRNTYAGANTTYAAEAWTFVNNVAVRGLAGAESKFAGYGVASQEFGSSSYHPGSTDISALSQIMSTVVGIYSGTIADPTHGAIYEGNPQNGKMSNFYNQFHQTLVTQKGTPAETHFYCGKP